MSALILISRLLDYPDDALWQHQQELTEAICQSHEFSAEQLQQLQQFTSELLAQPPLNAQAEYSDLFDRGRSVSLLLFEHVHGESRDRGQAMVDLLAQYERHGLQLNCNELPDYLPLYLEYLAQRPHAEVLAGLREITDILALLHARLQQRASRYQLLFQLLLALANSPVDHSELHASLQKQAASEPRDDTPQALDAVWYEEQVKFMADQGCSATAISAHQRRFANSTAAQYLQMSETCQPSRQQADLPQITPPPSSSIAQPTAACCTSTTQEGASL